MGVKRGGVNRDIRKRNVETREDNLRILIVTEGKETEPNYFQAICKEYRLKAVRIEHSFKGTTPEKVLESATTLFSEGDLRKRIFPQSYDEIYLIFNRDDHVHYMKALGMIEALDKKNV